MTSIEFLFNELWESPKDKLAWHTILKKAKEMHKQEIIEAYCNANDLIGAEQYYQETYGNKDSKTEPLNIDNFLKSFD